MIYTFDCTRLTLGDIQRLALAVHDPVASRAIDAFLVAAERCRTFEPPVMDLVADQIDPLLTAFMGALYLHLDGPLSEVAIDTHLSATNAGDTLLRSVLSGLPAEDTNGT